MLLNVRMGLYTVKYFADNSFHEHLPKCLKTILLFRCCMAGEDRCFDTQTAFSILISEYSKSFLILLNASAPVFVLIRINDLALLDLRSDSSSIFEIQSATVISETLETVAQLHNEQEYRLNRLFAKAYPSDEANQFFLRKSHLRDIF